MTDIKMEQAGSKENSYAEKKNWKKKGVRKKMTSVHDVIKLKWTLYFAFFSEKHQLFSFGIETFVFSLLPQTPILSITFLHENRVVSSSYHNLVSIPLD